jgi:N-acylethanolamine-hydrolysing acid amidase
LFIFQGKVVYSGITFAGYIGILTGQKPLAYTVSLDERDKGFEWENIFQLLLAKTTPVGFFLRSLLANEDSNFDYAIQQISKVEMIAPAYIIVGGIQKGEGAVVTRARTEALDVWKINTSEGRYVSL